MTVEIHPLIGYFNDLWKYRVKDNTWTWMSGVNATNKPGVSGEKGSHSAAYYPGAREKAIVWYDSSTQTLWLFGGYGYAKTSRGT